MRDALNALLLIVSVDVVVLMIWQFWAPFQAVERTHEKWLEGVQATYTETICESESSFYETFEFIYKALQASLGLIAQQLIYVF